MTMKAAMSARVSRVRTAASVTYASIVREILRTVMNTTSARSESSRRRIGSVLFAPGDDPRKLGKAIAAAATLAIADLEDAVAEPAKAAARDVVAAELARRAPDGGRCAVRINALDTPFAGDDLAMASAAGADAIVVPKARASSLRALDTGSLPPIIAIVETATGLQESAEIATAPGVWALLLGAVDLGVELRLTPRADGLELLFARSKLVLDSAAAQIAPPIDVVHVDIAADAALRAESELARSLGFGGKACIHPRQVPIVERAFAPTADELERARRVVDAYAAAAARGEGVVRVDGAMVDRPVYERALDIVGEQLEPTVP
jgi:citrate lyase beta subunit